jgi:hypothetical protein
MTEENFIRLNRPTYYLVKYTDEDLRAAVLIERERCALMCEELGAQGYGTLYIAASIRRGE